MFNSFDLILLKFIQLSSVQLWSQMAPVTAPRWASLSPSPVSWGKRSLVTTRSPLLILGCLTAIWLQVPEESSLRIVLSSWTRRRDEASLVLWKFSERLLCILGLGMKMPIRWWTASRLVVPRSLAHRLVGAVNLVHKMCWVFKITWPRCTNIPVLSDMTIL